MTEDEAVELLLREPKERIAPGNWREASKVVKKLAYLPSAIHQAAVYMNFADLSMSQFVEKYKTHEPEALKNIMEDTPNLRRYQENEDGSPLSAFTTWEMCLSHIGPDQERRKQVEHFLTLSAFLDSSSISEDLFMYVQRDTGCQPDWIRLFNFNSRMREQAGGGQSEICHGDDSTSEVSSSGQRTNDMSWHSTGYENLVKELRELSLLEIGAFDTSIKTFSLHHLVRDWLQLRLSFTEQQKLAREAITLLEAYLKSTMVSEASLRMKQEVLAHMDVCTSNDRMLLKREEGLGSVILESATTSFGLFYYRQGRFQDAASMFTSLLRNAEDCLGRRDSLTLRTRENLANVYRHLGRHKEAAMELEQVLTIREKDLGEEHLDTLNAAHFLANVYHFGQREKAEALYERVFASRYKLLGPEHPDTLSTANNLAIVYRLTKRYRDAIRMYQPVLELRVKQLGDEHPESLISAQGLAIVYRLERSWELAEKWQRWTLERRERQLGCEHPDTLMTIDNFASVFRDIGRYDEAMELYKRALRGRVKLLGFQSPPTLVTFHNLALMFRYQRRYDESKILHKFVLLSRRKQLGPNQPKTLMARDQLAEVCQFQGLFNEAKVVLTQAVVCRSKELGTHHPDTLRTAEFLKRISVKQVQ